MKLLLAPSLEDVNIQNQTEQKASPAFGLSHLKGVIKSHKKREQEKPIEEQDPYRMLLPVEGKVLNLYLQEGLRNKEIAQVLNMTPENVCHIKRRPHCAEIISRELDSEAIHEGLQVLEGSAVKAIRAGLGDMDIKNRLRAVDSLFKATGRYEKAKGMAEKNSAEEVATNIYKTAIQINMQQTKGTNE